MPPRTRTQTVDVEGSDPREAAASLPPSESQQGIEAQLATAQAIEDELLAKIQLKETAERIEQLRKRLEDGEVTEVPRPVVPIDNQSIASSSSVSYGGLPKSMRPRQIAPYKGKTVREHTEFVTSCELSFRLEPSLNKSDELRCNLAATWLEGEPRDAWLRHEKEPGFQRTWKGFKKFLLDLVEDPVNRGISTAIKYEEARQRPGQSAQTFATYLEMLEGELTAYSEEHRVQHFLAKLQPELRSKVITYPEIPQTRSALVALASRIEQANSSKSLEKGGQKDHKEERKGDNPHKRSSHSHQGRRNGDKAGVKRSRLSDEEEKRRRDNNLCFHCGKEGHRSAQCFLRNGEGAQRIRAVQPDSQHKGILQSKN